MNKYQLIKEEYIQELNTNAKYLKHIASGARVVLLSNDDENKVFTIGFRTPPKDSTGVPHILEHSTLCGSKKFPVKDPFVEIIKSSLNTFLNAMTYPDKTIYPCASCNDKDFMNIMEIYMDAVFNPNVYIHEEIFKQEGWHYELNSLDGDLIYNGVVYNEMKGVFSSSDSIVERKSMDSLFPDSIYGVESGGDPDYIPDLTYEQFKNFHKKYYSASNSYIVLYGNMNMEEKLQWMDEEYLSKYGVIDPDSNIDLQPAFEKPVYKTYQYPVGKDESLEDKTHYSYNVCIGSAKDSKLCLSFDILSDVLLDAVGAPLKQALLDSKIGHDIRNYYDSGVLQPYFQVVSKDAPSGKLHEFEQVIKDCLNKVVKEGINKQALLSAINSREFDVKEANFGAYPKGLYYTDTLLQTWLYDENDPFSRLKTNEIFTFLKEQVKTNYFEELITQYLLNNNHTSYCEFIPSNTLAEENEAKLKNKLLQYKNSLSQDELVKLIDDTKALKEYQATPSTKEELATIPVLSRSDINPNAPKMKNIKSNINNVDIYTHDYFTNGIGYLDLLFDLKNLNLDEIHYAGLLAKIFGELDTVNYKSEELDQIIKINTGGISTSINPISNVNGGCVKYFRASVKYLYNDKEAKAMELVSEMLLNTKFDNVNKLKELANRLKTMLSGMLASRGHSVSLYHAYGYFREADLIIDHTEGIGAYQFLKELVSKLDNEPNEVINNLVKVTKKIFNVNNLVVSYTGNSGNYDEPLKNFISLLYKENDNSNGYIYTPKTLNEGFKCQSQVQYVCRCGEFNPKDYTGAILPLKVALGYDYLWNQVRVLGGAYGVMLNINKDGRLGFTSYRDPKLKETIGAYEGALNYIDNFNPTEEDLTKFIISAIGELDTPYGPKLSGWFDFMNMVKGITDEDRQKERTECINATKETVKNCKKIFEGVLNQGIVCVIGNENKVEENKDVFQTTLNLL